MKIHGSLTGFLPILLWAGTAGFTDKATSNVHQTRKGDQTETTIDNVTYDTVTVMHGGKMSFGVVVKKHQKITRSSNAEGQTSKIALTLFLPGAPQPLAFERDADDMSFTEPHYVKAVKYGCCAAENAFELTSWETLKPILKFHTRYLEIEKPNSHEPYFVGYESVYDIAKLIHGNLYFANLNGTLQTIVVKAKDTVVFQRIQAWTPEIRAVAANPKDRFREDPEHPVLELWSHDGRKGREAVDGFSLYLTFQDDAAKDLKLEQRISVEKGLLNGKNDAVQTLVIE